MPRDRNLHAARGLGTGADKDMQKRGELPASSRTRRASKSEHREQPGFERYDGPNSPFRRWNSTSDRRSTRERRASQLRQKAERRASKGNTRAGSSLARHSRARKRRSAREHAYENDRISKADSYDYVRHGPNIPGHVKASVDMHMAAARNPFKRDTGLDTGTGSRGKTEKTRRGWAGQRVGDGMRREDRKQRRRELQTRLTRSGDSERRARYGRSQASKHSRKAQ